MNKTIHTPPMDLSVWGHSDMYSRAMTVTIQNPSPSMQGLRDIRDDLRGRIDALEAMLKDETAKFQEAQERALAEHKERMTAFNKALQGYRNMLSLEENLADANIVGTNNKVGPMPPEIKIPMPEQRPALADFFIAKLKELGRPMTKEELRFAALMAGYFPDGESGGRATHATLSNIARNGRIIIGDDGKYTANTLEKALL